MGKLLKGSEFAYNTALRSSTGFSPAHALFGYDPTLAANFNQAVPVESTGLVSTNREETLRSYHWAVADALCWAQVCQATQYNRHRRGLDLKVNMQVLAAPKAFGILTRFGKTLPLFFGPYTVVEVFPNNPNIERVSMHNQPHRNLINIGWLKVYHSREYRYKKPPVTNREQETRANEVIAIVGEERHSQISQRTIDHKDPERRASLFQTWHQACNIGPDADEDYPRIEIGSAEKEGGMPNIRGTPRMSDAEAIFDVIFDREDTDTPRPASGVEEGLFQTDGAM